MKTEVGPKTNFGKLNKAEVRKDKNMTKRTGESKIGNCWKRRNKDL
jgi:hypothetical protein